MCTHSRRDKGARIMKLKDYLNWKKAKEKENKNGSTKRKRKNHNHDSQRK